ncbi:TolB family protein [Microbacterium dauci]|uniref:Biopolymer transporter Tol n=1 Tax=Microbacterium dauci TaxID=3048008 RepID=A0ABT6ZAD4_9MICO|nr:hypothetical protein [Microbacterium sp. LX3-4]MDJ1113120.1 hypothetical protein [Microbacterium sp. LX3-4]
MTRIPPARGFSDGQRCRVHVYDLATGDDRIVFEHANVLLEAPNWAAEGLLLNGGGLLWSLDPDAADATLIQVELPGVPTLNNDHVLVPGTDDILLSANDGQIYRAPRAGGTAVRITDPDDPHWHFLHGVRPDAGRIAYTALELADGRAVQGGIRVANIDGSDDRAITPGQVADGSEWSPDGEWVYLNTEVFSPGHAQIARMREDGSELEQLTFDERVNWFPHLAPGGEATVYLSYPPGTQGHPADLTVELRVVRGDDWAHPQTVATLPGGQGTINVHSWSPEGARFAYVDYPFG